MSRYIDADALKKRVSELIVPDWTRTLIRSWLDSAPTVDAVPVVRCSECVHFAEWTAYEKTQFGVTRDGVCKYWNWISTNKNGFCYQGVRITDGYCADGERKDGETEQCNTYSLGKIEMPKGAMKKIIADGERKDGERRTDG